MKVADLRKSILQAAVQGKLVPQNLHDEPASELLKRIRKEKARLVKEGTIKKEKPLPPILEDEVPFDLPEGWAWCRLKECAKIGTGSTPLRTNTEFYKNGNIPWILSAATNDDFIFDADIFVTEKAVAANHLEINPIGTLIMAMYGQGKTRGQVSELAIAAATNQACATIQVEPSLSKAYVKLFLKNTYFDIRALAEGGAQPNLNLDKIKTYLMPLPPYEEQARIASLVDKLMARCDELEAAEKELDALEVNFADYLPKSILQAAVQGKLVPQDPSEEPATELLKRIRKEKIRLVKEGKIRKEKALPSVTEDEVPFDLPERWAWCRLGEIGEVVGGATPLTTDPSYYAKQGEGIAWITPADMKAVKENKISRGIKDITTAGYQSCSTRLIPKSSIVFSSRAPIGLIAFAENELCTNQGFKSIVPSVEATAPWIFYALKQLTENIIGRASGTTFLEVSGEFMRKEIIPLPPIAEQQRIVAKTDELLALCSYLKSNEELPFTVPPKLRVLPSRRTKQTPIAQDDFDGLRMAARGDASRGYSAKAMEAIDDLIGDDDDD